MTLGRPCGGPFRFNRRGVDMSNVFREFTKDQTGATAIEYGLLAALIGVGVVVGATTFGSATANTYTYLGNSVEAGMKRARQ